MKKLKFLFFALFAIMVCSAVTSCSDDDKNGTLDNPLIGLWGIQSYYYDGDYENAIVFNSDGTGVYYDNYPSLTSGILPFTYTYDSSSKTLVWLDSEALLPEEKSIIWKLTSISADIITYTDAKHGISDTLVRIK